MEQNFFIVLLERLAYLGRDSAEFEVGSGHAVDDTVARSLLGETGGSLEDSQ